tara:strand:+ start:619 stop:1989 length:1371 start_codon:yes stop_codon:yes gene_type:complete
LIPKKFKKIKTLVLLAGPGSGSKLFQSFLDGHRQVLMTPGYILMYFYPHWDKHLKYHNDWKKIINHFLILHPSIIDANKLKGGDYLYNLGKNKTKSVKVNKKNFIKKLNDYLKDEEINSKNFFLAVHLAYANCLGESIKRKKILIYHMHVCWYMKNFYKDFENVKTITMLRELKSNIPKRIPALEKPNEMHLNKTDAIFFKTRSYKNIIFEDFFSLDYLKSFKDKSHRVIKHEDLIIRKKNIMQNFCNYVGISNSKSLLKSTINNMTWNYEHDNKVEFQNGIAKHIMKYDKKNFFFYELFWLNNLIKSFNKTYSYKTNKVNFSIINTTLSFFFIFLPSKKELNLFITFFTIKFIKNYIISLYVEVFKIKLKQYEKNAFYFHKWSNKNYPFRSINFLNRKLNKNKNIFWVLIFILLKLFMFAFIPVAIVIEYISRIVICLKVYFKNILGLRFFPKKL